MSKGKKLALFMAIIIAIVIIGSAANRDISKSTGSTHTSTESILLSEKESEAGSQSESETEKESYGLQATVIQSSETVRDSSDNDGFKLTMLDVGQGLGILVEADGEYMLYDGGGRSRSSYVVSYLKSHGITNLRYIVASHYDEDHIAGLVGVMNTASVGTIIDPDYVTDTKIYSSFCNKLAASGAKEIHPSVGSSYSLGSAKFTVVSPKNYHAEDENSRSVAIRIVYGNFSAILTGDSLSDAEEDMINSGLTLSSDLYVAGHHGSSKSSSQAFISEVSPSCAFISCGADNPYGHPSQKTLNTLKNNGIQIFRSDMQGEVICYSDGKEYRFSKEPCNNYSPGTFFTEISETKTVKKKEQAEIVMPGDSGYSYVLNTSTHKFHYSYCNSVNQMADHNKQFADSKRDEIIARGYSPCGNCKP